MSVPLKFREIGDFHEYYSGKRTAPYLTIFVGGNHEASNHLFELYYGGWVAPNIYYLGAANVVRFGPLRIAGLSGIWKGYNYNKQHHERLPYNQDDVKSIYHVRELDVRKLLQIRTQVDIGISHDWPRGIEWMGNFKALFRQKDLFEADARAGTLGNSAAKYVMDRLRPPHWFSAHLHCKFAAVVKYDGEDSSKSILGPPVNGTGYLGPAATKNMDEIDLDLDGGTAPQHQPPEPSGQPRNDDEIDLDMGDDEPSKPPLTSNPNTPQPLHSQPASIETIPQDVRSQLPASFSRPQPTAKPTALTPPDLITNKTTHFLALDKCLPNRKFLQILDISPLHSSASPPYHLSYDKEWLAITRVFASDLTLGNPSAPVPPNKGEAFYRPLIEAKEKWIEEHLVATNRMRIPRNFESTAPVYDADVRVGNREQPREYTNEQTVAFCEMLGIANPFALSEEEREERVRRGPRAEEPRRDGGRAGAGRGGERGFGRARGRGGGRGRGRGFGR